MASSLLDAIIETARDWREPDHEAREESSRRTIGLGNRFTPEAIIFAINQQTHTVDANCLLEWIGDAAVAAPVKVGVLLPGNIPFAGFQDLIAVLLSGHQFVGKLSARSPYILPAFVADLKKAWARTPAQFSSTDAMIDESQALILTGTDKSVEHIRHKAIDAGIPSENILARGHRFSAAVLGGKETTSDLEALAEDTLLHEGLGCRSPAVVWAPKNSSPDGFLDALARFRAVFRGHADTRSSLKMQIAYHSAIGTPCGFADDESFLVTRGDPVPQQPGHLRWSEYDRIEDVRHWIEGNRARLQIVCASPEVQTRLPQNLASIVDLGMAQRPELGWEQGGENVISFLASLA